MPLSQIMKTAIVLDEAATVDKAISLMREKSAFSVAVVDKASRLLGLVPLEDLVSKFLLLPKEKYRAIRSASGATSGAQNPQKESLTKVPISGEIETRLVSMRPDETIARAAFLMAANNMQEILVEENSRVLGIVSAKSILPLIKTIGTKKNIQIAKMPEVDEIDRAEIMSYIDRAYEKISRVVTGDFALHVHFKEHGKGGARKKHEVHFKLVLQGKPIVSKAVEWKLLAAVKNSASALEREALAFAKRK